MLRQTQDLGSLQHCSDEEELQALITGVLCVQPQADVDRIKTAYVFMKMAHEGQQRVSGAPYYTHPLAVAEILVSLRMDVNTIIAGLLHDIVEDTQYTLNDVKAIFGDDVAGIVDGLTKLNRLDFEYYQEPQAENFRKFVLSAAIDMRVLIVKIADRLHNVRTLHHILSEPKRRRIAKESLEIYVPLAERIGVIWIQEEMQDICFHNLHPEEYEFIRNKLLIHKEGCNTIVYETIKHLEDLSKEYDLPAVVQGRYKSTYSIWNKMYKQHISFHQVSDIFAFRLIVNSVEDCYRCLWMIHSNYPAITGRFKDYISVPKMNGYQSLHTGVYSRAHKQNLEMQIRTHKMHHNAQVGMAAHFGYKENTAVVLDSYKQIADLVEAIQQASSPEEILECAKISNFSDTLFCLTPCNEIITLPIGSSVVDFAYAIHTNIGNTCIGARINGSIMPVNTILNNADHVEIMTSQYYSPDESWIAFAKTNRARVGIKRCLNNNKHGEYVRLGQEIFKYVCGEKAISHLKERDFIVFESKDQADFFYRIGMNKIKREEMARYFNNFGFWGDEEAEIDLSSFKSGVVVHLASCCQPCAQDRITMEHKKDGYVQIHRMNCVYVRSALMPCMDKREAALCSSVMSSALVNAFKKVQHREEYDDTKHKQMRAKSANSKFYYASWGKACDSRTQVHRLRLITMQNVGVMHKVSQIFAQHNIQVLNVSVENTANGLYVINVSIVDIDYSSICHVIAIFRTKSFVQSVIML